MSKIILLLLKNNKEMNIPYIILIDLDGTMVGDVSCYIAEWELFHTFTEKKDMKKWKDFKSFIIKKLCDGILRPYLADFHASLKKNFHFIEFYVYTASETQWANFLVSCIEEAIHIKFSRPIFTRDNCQIYINEYKKSIECVMPYIFTRLKKLYPDLRKISQLKNKIVLIDNNQVLDKKEQGKLIQCPTYEYVEYYDVFCRLNVESFLSSHIPITHKLGEQLKKYGLFPRKNFEYNIPAHVFRYYYYGQLCDNIRRTSQQKSPQKDTFWINLMEEMCKRKPKDFDTSTLKKIEKKL